MTELVSFEMLEITDEIKQEIMNGKSSIEIRNEALKQKVQTISCRWN